MLPPVRALPVIVLSLALVSGAAGLGHQLTWTRRFALGLGHELPAALALVAAFFGGLALGSWVPGGRLHRTGRPLAWAAGLEAVTGLWALVTLPAVPALNQLARDWMGAEPGLARQWTVAFALPVLGLLPATTALGAVLPALQRSLALAGRGRDLALLYAANTVGAALGVALTLGAMHPGWGFARTTLAWAWVNLVLAAALAALARGWPRGTAPGNPAPGSCPGPRGGLRTARPVVLWLGTGLLGVGFEVLAVRLLQLVLPGTVASFGLTVAVWLVGTALGASGLALLEKWRGDGEREAGPGWLPLATAAGLVAGLAGLVYAREPLQAALTRADRAGQSGWAAEALTVAVLVLPATVPMAMLFCRLARAAAQAGPGLGTALAWNTLGGTLAPGLFGAFLVPAIGTRGTAFLLVAGYLALQAWAGGRRWWPALPGACLLLVVPRTLDLVQPTPGARLVEVREGATDTVAVMAFADGHRSLAVNNRFVMGGTGATNAAARHGHLPLLLHPAPRRALFLGVGTGISLAAAGAYPGLEVVGVELVPEVVAMGGHFAPHNTLPPRGRIVVADARRYLQSDPGTFDVIVADLFHPARDGSATLYTREHFAALRARLRPGGLACQWLPLYQLNPSATQAILRAWLAEFPATALWWLRWNLDTPVLGLVGSRETPRFQPGWLHRRLADGVQPGPLRAVGLTDDFQLFGGWVGSLKAPGTPGKMNRDDHPLVAWEMAAAREGAWESGDLLDWTAEVAGTSDPFPADVPGWGAELASFRQARDAYLRGLAAEASGQAAVAEALMLASLPLSPSFPTAYSWLVSRAMAQAGGTPRESRRLLERLARERPDLPLAGDLLRRLGAGGGDTRAPGP